MRKKKCSRLSRCKGLVSDFQDAELRLFSRDAAEE